MASNTTIVSRPTPTSIDAIEIHASINEMHTYANNVTDHPVEEGSNVTDHSRPEPDQIQMDCLISNTPLSRGQATQNVKSGAVNFQSSSTGAVNLGEDSGLAQNAYQKLLQLRNEGTLIDVVTGLTRYTSMAITNISVPRDKTTFDSLRFSITLKKVRVVKNKLTRVVNAKDQRVGKKTKTGHKTTKATEEESSALFKSAEDLNNSNNETAKKAGKFLLSGGR